MADDAKRKLAGILALDLNQLKADVIQANEVLNRIGKDAKFEGITKNLSAQIKKAVEEGAKGADLSKLGVGKSSSKKSTDDTKAYREAMASLKQEQQYMQAILGIRKQLVTATSEQSAKLHQSETIYTQLHTKAQATTEQAKGRIKDEGQLLKLTQQEEVGKAKVLKLEGDIARAQDKIRENQEKQNKDAATQESIMAQVAAHFITIAVHAAMNTMKQFWTDAIQYATEYYDKLNEIRIVTGMSEAEAEALGANFRNIAEEMSVSSQEFLSGATVFFRQGLGSKEVEERLKATTMYAKTAGVSFEDAANMITASVNSIDRDARGMEMTAQRVADVYLYLGDNAATSGEEIGRAMQRSAAIADAAGVSFEMLGAYIATVSERTRQDAGTIGTALNAIMSRLTQVRKTGFKLEDGIGINDVEKALHDAAGVSLRNTNGEWRNLQDVFKDVAGKWNALTDAQRNYLATTMAGTRQQNVFRTLMADLAKDVDGASRAMELYTGALEAAGTASEKYEVYQESITAYHDRMVASLERIKDFLIRDEDIKMFYSTITKMSDALAEFFQMDAGKSTGGTPLEKAISEYNKLFASSWDAEAPVATIEQKLDATKNVFVETLKEMAPEISGATNMLWAAFSGSLNGHVPYNAPTGAMQNMILNYQEMYRMTQELAKNLPEGLTEIDEKSSPAAQSLLELMDAFYETWGIAFPLKSLLEDLGYEFNEMPGSVNNAAESYKNLADAAEKAYKAMLVKDFKESFGEYGGSGLENFVKGNSVQWVGLLETINSWMGKGLSMSDMGLSEEAQGAIGLYQRAMQLDDEDPEKMRKMAEATAILVEQLNLGTDAWASYAAAQEDAIKDEEGADLIHKLADSGSFEAMRREFDQMTEAEQKWVVKNSKAFQTVMKNAKATEKDIKALNKEATDLDFKELEDSGKVWEGTAKVIEKAGKGNKEFSKTYGKMIDQVGDMATAEDALAYIQSGVTDDTKMLNQAYSDLASYTGVSAESLRNDLSPAIWALQADEEMASNTIANLVYWMAQEAGITFNSDNWSQELSRLADDADTTTGAVAQLVQEMLSVAGASLSISPNGVVTVNWPNGTPSGYTGRKSSSGSGKKSGGGGGGGGGKSSGSGTSKTVSEIQKLTDMMKEVQELLEFHLSMIQQIESIYEGRGQYSNLLQVYEEERKAIEEQNEVLEENIKELEERLPAQQELVSSMDTASEKYDDEAKDLERLQDLHQEYTKKLLENAEALDELIKKIKEAEKARRQTYIDVEEMILEAIEDREERIQNMLEGRVAAEEMIMETLISMYERERDSIVQAAELKTTALQEEMDMLDEMLAKRREAADLADKEAELAELEAKLVQISADPTRRAEQLKLQEQISELRDELAWDTAEREVEAQKKSIEQQINSLEEYVQYVEDYYDELFTHPQKLISEVEEILLMSDEEIVQWMKENNEEFREATAASQTIMENEWQQTLDQMRGTLRLHWEEVHAIMAQGDEAIIQFLKDNSQAYAEASEAQAEAYVDEWKEKLEDLLEAYKMTYEEIQAYSYVPIRTSTSSSSSSSSGSPGGGSSSGGKKQTEPRPVETGGWSSRPRMTGMTYGNGGEARFTGLAWLDGTPNKPERVLSPYQTELFEDMIESLHNIRVATSSYSFSSPELGSPAGGSVYLDGDIVVNVGSLADDADYEEVAAKVMETIAEEISRSSVVGGLRTSY